MPYKKNKPNNTSIKQNTSYEGETIEEKVFRIINNNEPIKDGAPLIYTDRANGVEEQYDIRTDRWDIAIEAMDKVSKSHIARRENYIKERDTKKENKETKPETGANTSDLTNNN